MMKELVLDDEDIGISWAVEIASCLEGIALYVLTTYFRIPKNGGHEPLHYHLQSNVCYTFVGEDLDLGDTNRQYVLLGKF